MFPPCDAGYPDPEVVWFKDDQSIRESRHFQIDYDEDGNCSLIISDVCGDDDAKYTCKAVNSLGEATCTAELIVETMEEGEGEGLYGCESWTVKKAEHHSSKASILRHSAFFIHT